MSYVLVGLGNPEIKYERTRHNAGFMFIDLFRKYLEERGYKCSEWAEEKLFDAYVSQCQGGADSFTLIKPTTYMNRSGEAVRKWVEKKSVDVENELVLIHDDLDIEQGKFKIQKEKSPKEHNGVISVESQLRRKDFLRVRVGVEARNDRKIPGDDYVLMRMKDDDLQNLVNAIKLGNIALYEQLTSQQLS